MTTPMVPSSVLHQSALIPSFKLLALACLTTLILGCEPEPPATSESEATGTAEEPIALTTAQATGLVQPLWQQAATALTSAVSEAKALDQTIKAFLEQPQISTLNTARQQWQTTFIQIQQLQPFLFLDSATGAPAGLQRLKQWRFNLSAWPLQPGYLDSYGIYLHSGIVNDIALTIDPSNLRRQHGLTTAEDVVLGLHAMEFLLWPTDSDDISKRFEQQTTVPLALEQSGLTLNELPQNRRRELIKLQSQLLVSDLTVMQQQWQDSGILTRAFLTLTPQQQLMTLHHSFSTSLSTLRQLLLLHSPSDNNAEDDNLSYNQFAGNREQAMAAQLQTLLSVYFETASVEADTLATVLLDAEQQQEFDTLMREAIGELEKTEASPEQVMEKLSGAIILLTAIAADMR